MLVQPGKAWYVSELARRMGVPSSSLQRELQDLTQAGILKTHRQGRMAFYQANADSPVFSDLRGLLLKTVGLVDVLADTLKPPAAKLRVVFLHGSIASGNEQSDSDIDLMVVARYRQRNLRCLYGVHVNCSAGRSIPRSTHGRNSTRNELQKIIF